MTWLCLTTMKKSDIIVHGSRLVKELPHGRDTNTNKGGHIVSEI